MIRMSRQYLLGADDYASQLVESQLHLVRKNFAALSELVRRGKVMEEW